MATGPRVLWVQIGTPIELVEGCGIYLTIKETLSRTMTKRSLVMIYGVFLVSIMDVASIYGLIILAV